MKRITLARPEIGLRERRAVDAVLRSGQLAQGARVAKFEAAFSESFGVAESIAVNSGTSGLHLSLLGLGVGPGDEVIVPSFTFAATANAVAMTGAKPVFADIDPATLTISAAETRRLVTSRTVGIIPVHLYGLPADMTGITSLADEKKLFVVEDAAQAHLAEVEGRKVGSIGNAGVFSFYPTKNMTTGEGGMITTSDSALARKIRLLRNQGMIKRYQHEIPGLNNRMTEIAAAIGLVQLERLPQWTERRIKNAEFLTAGLVHAQIQLVPSGYKHVFHQLTLRAPASKREAIRQNFERHGVDTDVYYPSGVDTMAPYASPEVLPNSLAASQEVFSIPVRPSLSNRELRRIRVAIESMRELL